ncbi:hypothetical protein IAF42_19810 [Acinetobacter baumannii]|nr:hypothetical protein [Acinetobacter baumannii]MBD0168462.1 hypothetical protein [Acinetobacter baumannii]
MTKQVFEYLEEKASQVIDTSLLPLDCLKNLNELSGALCLSSNLCGLKDLVFIKPNTTKPTIPKIIDS